MSKARRGSPLKKESPGSSRGICPVCKRSGIKLLYEFQASEEKTIILCKQCHAAAKAGHLKEVLAGA